MTRTLIAALLLLAVDGIASAQNLDDLNLQVHGYATQAFIYSNHNNWDTTGSTDGSPAWTEAVVNLTIQPQCRLRVGVQARYSLLGTLGNQITLDWAQADFKVNEHFGVRAGKVKTESGLFVTSQDIDPSQLWILLPQSIYAVGSRDSILAHYGGLLYGTFQLGKPLGSLDYRVYGGQRIVDTQDQDLAPSINMGIVIPNGFAGPTYGGSLRWHTPLQGLMLGVSEGSQKLGGQIRAFGVPGSFASIPFNSPYFFGIYERRKFMVASEYARIAPHGTVSFSYPGVPPIRSESDRRAFYAMTSYKPTSRLGVGAYYSSASDRKVPVSSARFQKDCTLSARYDVNSFFYLKAEQHWMDGTLMGFSATNNTNLQPKARMTLLKLGVSF